MSNRKLGGKACDLHSEFTAFPHPVYPYQIDGAC
jgi:hypothetical protein